MIIGDKPDPFANVVEVLSGHYSPETALLVEDYPYGRSLRCKIRYWLDVHPRKGTRFVSQTTNPKREGEFWNKPHASTYNPFGAMFKDEKGHVHWHGLSGYDFDKAELFLERFAAGLRPEQVQELQMIIKVVKVRLAKEAAAKAAKSAADAVQVLGAQLQAATDA